MSIDPALAISAGGIVAVGAAALYSYLTGDSAGADIDNDGESEVTFEDGVEDFDVDLDGDEEGDRTDPEPDVVLSKDSLSDVKGIGPTRAEDLAAAGFETVTDIYYASDSDITDVEGIGEYTVEQIREDIGGIDQEAQGNPSESAESTETGDEIGGSSGTDETASNSADDSESSTDGEQTDSTADAGDDTESNGE